MGNPGLPAANYKFNTMQEIKSHSSVLFNERMAILFYLLDMKSIGLNTDYDLQQMLEVRAILKQIYKNMRTLIRNNPTMRATLNLETKDNGIYVTDVAIGVIDRMVEYSQANGFTERNLFIIVGELNNFEVMIKDVLQYYNYFIRPDFKQKPDIEIATEGYKELSDKSTIEQLKGIVGKKHRIDFDNLGSSRIELNPEIEFDKVVDGEIGEDEDETDFALSKAKDEEEDDEITSN